MSDTSGTAYTQLKQCFPNFSTAVYFSFLEYTTVGSAYNLPLRWRLLEGMISMAGLLTFAWSTGVLFTVAQEFQEQQLQLLKQKHEKRHTQHGPGASPPTGQPH